MKLLRSLVVVCLLVGLFVAPAAAWEFPEIDLGGATVYLWCWYDIGMSELIAEAEELFNCKIELPLVSWEGQTDTYMSRLLAGDSEYDIWYVSHSSAIPIMRDGAFYPMDEVLPPEYFERLDPHVQAMINAVKLDEHIYAFLTMHSAMNDMTFWVWNKTLFEREGLPDLEEAYYNGEWTWELATEIAIKATRDTDGDGIVDQYGFSEVYAWPFVLAHGGTVVKQNPDTGRWEFAMNDEPALQALQQIYEWNHVHGVAEGDWNQTPFREGKRAFANMPAWMLWALPNEMDDEYGILPPPKGPNNDDYSTSTDLINMFYIPANSADPLAMAAIVDFLMGDPEDYWYNVIENQIVGQAPDRVSAEVMEDAIVLWDGQFDLTRGNMGTLLDDAIWTIISGEKTPAQAMSEIAPQAQAAIDDLLN
jgi:multiple sugar transport system substrate-binding protein